MTTNDPPYPNGWDTVDATTVVRLSALQLIALTHHHLRQKVAVAASIGQLLTDGVFGFSCLDQQAAIGQLQLHVAAIEQVQQSITEWMKARVDSDGNWVSDEYGALPLLDQDGS